MRLWDILKTDLTPPFLRKYRRKPPETRKRRFAWWHRPWKGPLLFLIRRQAKRRDLISVFAQIDSMVRANAHLAGGLGAASLDAPNGTVKAVLALLGDEIEGGSALSEAMEKLPRFFPPHTTDVVRAGEDTGRLGESVDRIMSALQRDLAEGAKTLEHLVYIFYLFTLHLVVGPFFLVKVIPVFAEIYADFGSGLPAPTQFLIDISESFTAHAFAIMGLGAILVLAVELVRRIHGRSARMQTIVTFCLLPIPFLGTMHVKRHVARLANILEKLIAGGIPLADALKSTATAHVNAPFARALLRVAAGVEQGNPLSGAMEREGLLFRRSFRTLVSLGEGSGMLAEAFGYAAELYQRDAAKTARMLADAAVPLCVMASACATALVFIGMMIAIIGLSDMMAMTL